MKTKIFEVVGIDLQISKINPPVLVISASGHTTTSGWTNGELSPFIYIMPPQDGIYEFDFVATPPPGIAAEVISPITAKFVWPNFPSDLKGVRIYARQNELEAKLSGGGQAKLDGGGGGFPHGLSLEAASSMQNITLNAIVIPEKNGKRLIVHGSIITYRDDDVITVVMAKPQGFNPAILLLRLDIQEGKGPMKGTPKLFFYSDTKIDYRQVSLIYGPGALITTDVKVVG